MRHLMAGEPLHECGSLLQVTLGGWFRRRTTGRPAILTAEHVLTPDPLRNPAPPPGRVAHNGVLDRTGEHLLLCHPGRGEPVARVLASYERGPLGHAAELDACIAEPFDLSAATAEIPLLPWTPGIAAPVAGRLVAKFTRGSGLRYGRVLLLGRVEHRSSTAHDVIIAADDGQSFAERGDSGALVVDLHARAVIGMHVGEIQQVPVGGRRFPLLWRAQAIGPILDAFGLEPL